MKDRVATMPMVLPESGRLLGIVCDALRLSLPPARKGHGRRFLTGERVAVPEETRLGIVRSLVEEALGAGYFGEVVVGTVGMERGWIEQVPTGVINLMRRWDHTVGHLAGVHIPVERTTFVTECLRAAVVDVALRAAACRMLAKLPLMSPATKTISFAEVPSWARSGGAAAGLARRVRECGITHDALHASNTLDDWLRGRRRPLPESLRELAQKLAGNESVGAWRLHLLWDFGLAYIADALRSVVGNDVVDELAAALSRLTHLCVYPMTILPERHREAALIEIVQWGTMAPVARELCEWLQQQEGLAMRVEWARALALGGRPWSLLWLVASLPPVPELPGDPSIPVGLIERLSAWVHDPARSPGELLMICEGHSALYMWLMRVVVHRLVASGEFVAAAPIVGALADTLGGAALHLEAAALLVGADQPDEVARHLAAIPADDVLRGAADALAAMDHVVAGQHHEALRALDEIEIEDDGPMVHRMRAEALLGAGQASEALELVERVIASVPHDAVANELAARCCAALGRAREETRYAKVAERLGRPRARARRTGRGAAGR